MPPPRGGEAEHSLACPVPAQSMEQDLPYPLPRVPGALILALLLAPASPHVTAPFSMLITYNKFNTTKETIKT